MEGVPKAADPKKGGGSFAFKKKRKARPGAPEVPTGLEDAPTPAAKAGADDRQRQVGAVLQPTNANVDALETGMTHEAGGQPTPSGPPAPARPPLECDGTFLRCLETALCRELEVAPEEARSTQVHDLLLSAVGALAKCTGEGADNVAEWARSHSPRLEQNVTKQACIERLEEEKNRWHQVSSWADALSLEGEWHGPQQASVPPVTLAAEYRPDNGQQLKAACTRASFVLDDVERQLRGAKKAKMDLNDASRAATKAARSRAFSGYRDVDDPAKLIKSIAS